MDALTPELIGFAAVAVAIGTQYAVTNRWRGRIDEKIARAERDREVLHTRVSEKEAALIDQVKQLTETVTALKIEVVRLNERLAHVERD